MGEVWDRLVELSLGQFILQRTQELGHRSLMSLYQASNFSFSYEYLRQIVLDRRVPSPAKVAELAHFLKTSKEDLLQLAANYKLGQMMARYYKSSTKPSELDLLAPEKIPQVMKASSHETKFLKVLRLLPPTQQQQAYDFIKFLRQEWRRKLK